MQGHETESGQKVFFFFFFSLFPPTFRPCAKIREGREREKQDQNIEPKTCRKMLDNSV